MRALYTLLFYLLTPIFVARLYLRSIKIPGYRLRMRERFGFLAIPPLKKSIWVHAVSVGEVIAAAPFIQQLKMRYPHLPIVVTTMTPGGLDRLQALLHDQVFSVFAPYDLPGAIARFLKRTKPIACFLMETELWPNYLYACHAAKIPSVVMNGRLSARSLQRYLFFKPFTKIFATLVTHVLAQYEHDAQHFAALGIPASRITIAGNIKFDMTLSPDLLVKGAALRETLGQERPVWIAASTHEGEEEILLAAHEKVLQQHPRTLLIIVPRHQNRFNTVSEQCEKKFLTARRSRAETVSLQTQVYVGDTMGELMLLYAASDIAFVGGSLNDTGGHNMLEPALLKKPILSGPEVTNFLVISELLAAAGGLFFVRDAQTCATAVSEFIAHPKRAQQCGLQAYTVVEKNRGALERQVEKACQWINKENHVC